jgi:hypothetical protein
MTLRVIGVRLWIFTFDDQSEYSESDPVLTLTPFLV